MIESHFQMYPQPNQGGRSFLEIFRSHSGPTPIEGYLTEKIHGHNDVDHRSKEPEQDRSIFHEKSIESVKERSRNIV